MKPYRTITIEECGEPLVPIPGALFKFFDPHPYTAAGAPYGGASPWMLRVGALAALERAQARLQSRCPGWKIIIFEAYRPNAVQAYMVELEFAARAKLAGLDYATLTAADRERLAPEVFRIWGVPSEDPRSPPLHSTGGAVDCTLLDGGGQIVDMGGAIDENSDRSNPDYYQSAQDPAGRLIHANRCLLYDVMRAENFHRIQDEWWHFSRGDQYWAWTERVLGHDPLALSRYGRADLLEHAASG
ncbi:MAG: D-alanyl-D-alanine dipeptidase [Pseudomonadota bacterium]|nr:D-alanyl-D-alanine dipeptidase [Pseudomonadota bacterium]